MPGRHIAICTTLALLGAACSFSPGAAPDASGGRDAEPSIDAGRDAAVGIDASVDAAAPCMQGVSCDDMDTCTTFDSCLAGSCQGVKLSDAACPNCAGTCDDASCAANPRRCCEQACPGGECPVCPSGCSCVLDCGQSRPCNATCSSGSTCAVAGSNDGIDGIYDVTCEAGSLCAVTCVGNEAGDSGNPACRVTCEANAQCLMSCEFQSATCDLDCPSGATSCMNNITVCNRPCP